VGFWWRNSLLCCATTIVEFGCLFGVGCAWYNQNLLVLLRSFTLYEKMEPIDEFFILDRQVLIDQSTEKFFYSRKHDGKRLSLVMSDEFTSNQRGFGRGEDRFFEAINRPDTTNEALQFCWILLYCALFVNHFLLNVVSSCYR
jgi:hypothetical protein